MQIDLSERWQPSDRNVYLVMNYTDVRASMNVSVGGASAARDSLHSQDVLDLELVHGQNKLYKT